MGEQLKKTFGNQVETKLSAISDLEDRNNKLKDEIETLKNKLDTNVAVGEEVLSLRADLESTTDKMNSLKKEIDVLRDEKSHVESILKEEGERTKLAESSLAKQQVILQQYVKENDEAKQKIKDLEKNLSDLTSDLHTTREQLTEESKQNVKEKENLSSEVESCRKRIEKMETKREE